VKTLLELDSVAARYGPVQALSDVSLVVREGEVVAVLGANGAGKTTTLKAISGLLPVSGGRMTFEGEDITHATPRRILGAGIAHCPEGRHVFPEMSVHENLEMGCYLRSDASGIERDMALVFESFPVLAERRRQPAGTLSGGEQQMLAIGRAFMSAPRLMLFDEPSLGLAPNIVERTFGIIRELRARGMTVLMVEQNAYAALEMCDRAYLLETGEVVLQGTGASLLDDPHVRTAYLGG
jgi:branched-chain amino acid transport system ATP-binding protein